MTTFSRFLALALFLHGALLAGTCVAAAPELEAFDLRKCVRWRITPDNDSARSPAWRAAKARARSGLQVFVAGAELPEGGHLRKFGACALRRDGRRLRLGCVPTLDFPLAGASFASAPVQKFRTATTLACTSGCDQKIPDAVYLLNAPAPADAALAEKEERERGMRFRRTCREQR
jgi:hypothetical protein